MCTSLANMLYEPGVDAERGNVLVTVVAGSSAASLAPVSPAGSPLVAMLCRTVRKCTCLAQDQTSL